jgi:acetate kinase
MTSRSGGTVLVVNAGSSSLKYELVDVDSGDHTARGAVGAVGEPGGTLRHERLGADAVARPVGAVSHGEAVGLMFDCFSREGPSLDHVVGVGHRVVHGGTRFTGPALVDDDVIKEIELLVPLAPLHNQVALDCISAVTARLPGAPQVAVFDTAFHTSVPEAATAFALPGEVVEPHGLRRYGFHGTSVEYVVGQAAVVLGKELSDTSLIVCHLGNGASVTAVRDGRSVDTSMGFSPLGGLVMGTRSGDVDASAVLYLLDQAGMSASEVEDLLNHGSGLQGLAGDSDMRRVRARAELGEPEALRALAICTHRIRTYIGAALAQVPDLDALVFTGGIGENDARLRDDVCTPLAHLAIPRVLVVRTDEEHQIALHTIELVNRPEDHHHADHPAT